MIPESAAGVTVTGGMKREGPGEPLRPSVVLTTRSATGSRDVIHQMTPAEAERLGAELAAVANRARRAS